jgi:hypothetical protein
MSKLKQSIGEMFEAALLSTGLPVMSVRQDGWRRATLPIVCHPARVILDQNSQSGFDAT